MNWRHFPAWIQTMGGRYPPIRRAQAGPAPLWLVVKEGYWQGRRAWRWRAVDLESGRTACSGPRDGHESGDSAAGAARALGLNITAVRQIPLEQADDADDGIRGVLADITG